MALNVTVYGCKLTMHGRLADVAPVMCELVARARPGSADAMRDTLAEMQLMRIPPLSHVFEPGIDVGSGERLQVTGVHRGVYDVEFSRPYSPDPNAFSEHMQPAFERARQKAAAKQQASIGQLVDSAYLN